MRRRQGRMSLRDTILRNQAADRYYASMSEREDVDPAGIFANEPVPAAPRKRVKRELDSVNAIPLESEIQKQIMVFLGSHPKVAWRIRINAGEFVQGDAHIKTHYGLRNDEAISDIVGQLTNGRFFSCEVKRPPFTSPRNQREWAQENFIIRVRRNGGIAFFATSLEQATERFNAAIT